MMVYLSQTFRTEVQVDRIKIVTGGNRFCHGINPLVQSINEIGRIFNLVLQLLYLLLQRIALLALPRNVFLHPPILQL